MINHSKNVVHPENTADVHMQNIEHQYLARYLAQENSHLHAFLHTVSLYRPFDDQQKQPSPIHFSREKSEEETRPSLREYGKVFFGLNKVLLFVNIYKMDQNLYEKCVIYIHPGAL